MSTPGSCASPRWRPRATTRSRSMRACWPPPAAAWARRSKQVVHTGQIEPAVAFASQGSVLPAKDTRGLPVVSINVPEVDVEFLRVRESQLPRFFAQYQRGGSRGAWSLDEDYSQHKPLGELADSVYLNRFVLGGKPNERMVSYLPVQDIKQLQEPGLYFAVMKRVGRYSDQLQTAFFSVSDLGLHARAYKDTLFVHTASLADGSADRRLRSCACSTPRARPCSRASTDGNGNALLNYTLDAAHVLVASRGKDVTSCLPFNQPALDLSEFAVAGREQRLVRRLRLVRPRPLPPRRDRAPVRAAARLRRQAGQGRAAAVPAPEAARRQDLPRDPPAAGRAGLLQPSSRPSRPRRPPGAGRSSSAPTRPASAGGPGHDPAHRGVPARAHEAGPGPRAEDRSSPARACACRPTRAYLYGAPADGNRFTAKHGRGRGAAAAGRACRAGSSATPTLQLPQRGQGRGRCHARRPTASCEETWRCPTKRQGQGADRRWRPSSPAACTKPAGARSPATLKRVLWPADVLAGVRPLFDPDKDGARRPTARRASN